MPRPHLHWITLAAALALPAPARDPAPAALEDPRLLDALRVDPTTRAPRLTREDLRQESPGGQVVALQRTLAAGRGELQNFGPAWASLLDARLHRLPSGEVWLQDERGGLRQLVGAPGQQVAESGAPTRLEEQADGGALARDLWSEWRFDPEGRLIALRRGELELALRRRADGLVEALEGPAGALRLERDQGGLLVAATAACGARVDYERDARGNLARVRRGGLQESYAYDPAGRLESVCGGLGRLTRDELGLVVRYEAQGRPTLILEPVVPAPAGALLAVRQRRGGAETLFLVDRSLRRLEERGLGQGATSTVLELDERLRPVLIRQGARQERRSFDAEGRLAQRVDADGTTRYVYPGPTSLLPAAVIHDRLGTTRLIQDGQGRLLGWQTADGLSGFVRRDPTGRPSGMDTPRQSTRVTRDRQGRPARVEGPRGALELQHDAAGRVARLVRAGVGALEIAYDAAGGRVLRARDERGALVRETEEDALGRPVRVRDARGQVRRYEYDAAGLLRRVHDAVGLRVELTWSAEGELLALSDAQGHTTSFRRQEDGALLIEDPAAGARRVRRDAQGRLVEQVRGEVRVACAYDAAGRLVSRDTPAGRESFEYDPQGRLVGMSGPDGGLRFAWDEAGRLARVEDPALGQGIGFRWDEAGRRIETRYPWGTVRHERDAAGRLIGLVLPEGQRIAIELLPDGRRRQVRYPNGVVSTWTWAGARLSEVRTARGEELLELRRYGWDEAGRPSWIEDAQGVRTRFQRDARGQLTAAQGPEELAWSWDPAGNRTRAPEGGARHGPGNRLLAQGEETFAWDAHGALISRSGPAGETRYEWDHHRRLRRVTLPDGREVRYGYAPNGARLWREGPEGRTRYLHDLGGLAAEFGPDGRLSQGWVLGSGLDDVLAVRRGEAGETCYFHQDLLHNVIALSDAQGRVAARYAYDPFGQLRAAEGPAADWNLVRFSSRPVDPESGLVDLRARQYDPRLGRFVTPDPAGQLGGMNLYAYVGGDPTSATDPRGLWPRLPDPLGALDEALDAGSDVVGGAGDLVGSGARWTWDNVAAPAIEGTLAAGDYYLTDFALGPGRNPFFFPGGNPFALHESMALVGGTAFGVAALSMGPLLLAHDLVSDPLGTLEELTALAAFSHPSTALAATLGNGGRNPVLEGHAALGAGWVEALFTDPDAFWAQTGLYAPHAAALWATGGVGSLSPAASAGMVRLSAAVQSLHAATTTAAFLERLGLIRELVGKLSREQIAREAAQRTKSDPPSLEELLERGFGEAPGEGSSSPGIVETLDAQGR